MKQGRQQELIRLSLALIAGWLLGLVVGYPAWGMLLGLVAYVLLLLRALLGLSRWLAKGAVGLPPRQSGICEQIGDYVYQRQRRSLKRGRRLADMVSSFRDSMGAIPDGLVVLDQQRGIEWCNGIARHFLGLRYPTDIGQRIDNLVRDPLFTSYVQTPDHTRAVDIYSPVNSDRHLEVRLLPFGEQQSLLVVRDVSLLHRLQRVRSDFVINASHELRTPLTVMRGYMEAVEDEQELPEPLRYPLTQVSRQVDRMDRLVRDLLELANLEREGPGQAETDIDVVRLIESLMSEASALSGDKQHEFTLELEPGLGLYGDEKALFSAISNLIFNAVHYTQKGGHITIRWQLREQQPVFEVEDNGPGIAKQHLSRLTERFYRVDVGRSRDSGGTGLGLSIVRHVMLNHNGELDIKSVLGKGSCFSCRFPEQRARLLRQSRQQASIG